ncbi:PilZ domain-containing protein [Leptospira ilyithenensis]|uniref:PilZ domain-containing protein n=1 Tax=Leptospira ilyithenensis TaxID=2484901 RepID=A0A4R9LWV7_9LEPT|nr:PilZ domain-containing protein [Leptospira ilyithenensis]TGN14069.1 PilZ domain-containing protein [Leptospira ilyithenensis]
MSAFQQNLPVQIFPKENNPEGHKFQGILEAMESNRMKIKIDQTFLSQNHSGSILVEFSMSNYNFQFESSLLPDTENDFIFILKPRVIHKSQIRKSPRLKTFIKFNFTLWTEGGRYEGAITDISTVGIKMTSEKEIHKNTILSLNVFIPGTSLRFICQGLVMWCRSDPNQNNLFLSGIKFTTLSIDAMKKVDKFIQDQLKFEVENS